MSLSRGLQICCNSCATWYTPKEVDHVTDSCPRCGGDLWHAHEVGEQTPWMAMQAELVKVEIASLEDRLDRLRTKLIDELWDNL